MDNLDLDDICASVGYTATRQLCAWYSAQDLYVPLTFRADHPLRHIIGESALQALIRDFAGERLRIPHPAEDSRYRRDRVIAELIAGGASNEGIAQLFEISTRTVETTRADLEVRGWLVYAAAPRRRAPGRPGGGGLPRPDLMTAVSG